MFETITIVGLGLMGGSLALALRDKCRRLVGVVRRPEAAAAARDVVDEATTDSLAGVREAEIVVLATPVRTILRQVEQLGPRLPSDCLLIDLGSTKQEIVAAMARLPDPVQALGGHPMCGKEQAGLQAATADLYQDQIFVLCPPPGADSRTLARGETLVRAVGARPLILEAAHHDRLVAASSHLPYLLSAGLVAAAASVAEENPLLSQLVSSGFRDTSRLAGSDVVMMRDILLTNRPAILKTLNRCQTWINALSQHLEAGDREAVQSMLEKVQSQQKELRP